MGDAVSFLAWIMIIQGVLALLGVAYLFAIEGSREFLLIGTVVFVGAASVVPGVYFLVYAD